MKNRVNKMFFYLFLISLFFFKIPNLYLVPFYKNAFLTTQALSRIFFVLIFCFQLIKYSLSKKPIITNKNSKRTVFLILLFFILQSLTIIIVVNEMSFLSRYKDIILSFIAFFVFFFYKNYYRQIILTFLISASINYLYQFFVFFYQDFFINTLSNFIYQKHAELVIAKIQQNRLYTDTYDEIILPFLFIYPLGKSFNKNLTFYFLFISTAFFSLISNIRSRFLMFMVSLISSLLIFKKISFKKIFITSLSFFIIGFLINNFMRHHIGYSFVDRLLLESEVQDIRTVNFRWEQIKKSLEMGKSSLLGVGLGNYYDNLESINKNYFIVNKSQLILSRGAQEFVHNIFGTILAESGYISLLVFIIILLSFIKRDFFLLRQGKDYEKAFVIAFWSIFSYGLFNPVLPASYQVLFWGIRGVLIE